MPVELGRTAHRLAGVVDDEVKPVAGRAELLAERLHARGVPQVKPEDLQPAAPLLEVRLGRVTRGTVARETRRHDQLGARAQELDPRLVADLDAAAGEERDAPLQISGLRALGVVEVAARRAKLIVEPVDSDVELLAHVAVLGLDNLAEFGVVDVVLLEAVRRKDVGRRVDRLLAECADAGVRKHRLDPSRLGRLLVPPNSLAPAAPLDEIRLVDIAGGPQQLCPLLDRECAEQCAVGDDLFEDGESRLQPLRVGRGGVAPLLESAYGHGPAG